MYDKTSTCCALPCRQTSETTHVVTLNDLTHPLPFNRGTAGHYHSQPCPVVPLTRVVTVPALTPSGGTHSQLGEHPQSLFVVLLLCHPEGVLVLHDVCQHGSTQEHHVFPPRRVLNADLELLQCEHKSVFRNDP